MNREHPNACNKMISDWWGWWNCCKPPGHGGEHCAGPTSGCGCDRKECPGWLHAPSAKGRCSSCDFTFDGDKHSLTPRHSPVDAAPTPAPSGADTKETP